VGHAPSDILVDFLTFTLGTGQEESRRDGIETIEAIRGSRSTPEVGTTLGLSNISFGLKPAARWCSTRCSCTSARRPA
jgi:5-methyltetrahydrofolate--homocysteine methyltransferase